jgi:hypothetical protein
MQLLAAPDSEKAQAVENVLQRQRLERYATAAGSSDRTVLFRFYMWNCSLGEAFYFPIQMAEIAARNAIHNALLFWLQERWFENQTFLKLLDPRYRDELKNCIAEESKQHGSAMTAHHVCSGMTFGFWEHLTTKRFARMLWKRGIRHNFSNAPAAIDELEKLHGLIESVRRWRNRIAHHKAIFDKSPSKKLQDVLLLIRWVCSDTADWVTTANSVQTIINAKPKS